MDEILTPEQWFELKSRIRNQYPELTDNDLQYHEASETDLLTMVLYSIIRTKEIMKEVMRSPNRLSPLKNYRRYIRKHRSMMETE